MSKRISCPDCELVAINGVICHEWGCPSSHLFTKRECKWCGRGFKPKTKEQVTCSKSCQKLWCH